MTNNGFKSGQLTCTMKSNVPPGQVVKLIDGSWQDGYIAFANGEKRLNYFDEFNLNKQFFSRRIQDISTFDSIEGYVTELNFWRSSATGIFEEIAIEREENSFYIQYFVLNTSGDEDGNCWYRNSSTMVGSHNIRHGIFSGSLNSIEIVWPEKRLNIFMTVGDCYEEG